MSPRSWRLPWFLAVLTVGLVFGWVARGERQAGRSIDTPAEGRVAVDAPAAPCSAKALPAVQVRSEDPATARVETPKGRRPAPSPTPASLLQAIERGSDQERQDALLAARGQALVLPEDLLRSRWETDPSEAVRLLALEALVERLNGDTPALRSLLLATRGMPGAMLQRRAAETLEELDECERSDAANPQPGVPPG